nr:immunoglobulin heavy chain junction region [Mus musculus]
CTRSYSYYAMDYW